MGRMQDVLKGARRMEFLVIAALLAILIVFMMNTDVPDTIGMSAEERRMAGILSEIEGAGEVSVMISSDASGAVQGVVATASGAESIGVQLKIRNAVRALTDLAPERIEVYAAGST